ncbi:Ras- protein Rap-1A [Coemansia sp. RSA 2050]|nr:Ras- protein Rap-1A [Coemansia sp. RSA 2050]KAJ2737284.1 Ras- protein Rap-1A [Coemansia sp. BCRC 34962]
MKSMLIPEYKVVMLGTGAEHVRRVKDSEKVAIVLVGNKCDLEEMRTVSTLEGEKTARRMRSGFYETSAKKLVNVDDMFIQSVRRIKYFGKQTRTSGTGSSTSQESKGSSTQSKRDTVKPDARLNYTKSWLPAKKATPPPPPPAAVENTSDIIDSYYAMSDEYRAPCPAPNRRLTTAPEKTRPVSRVPDRRRSIRGKSVHPPARKPEGGAALPAKPENERPVIRLVGYGADIQKLQQKSSANVNKALPVPKRRRQWQAHACPIL